MLSDMSTASHPLLADILTGMANCEKGMNMHGALFNSSRTFFFNFINFCFLYLYRRQISFLYGGSFTRTHWAIFELLWSRRSQATP